MWPTPSVKGNYNRKGASKKAGDGLETAVLRSVLSSRASEDSTSDSSAPAGSADGSAKSTPGQGEFWPGTGPTSRGTETCERLWPTPTAAHEGAYTYDQGNSSKPRPTLSGAVQLSELTSSAAVSPASRSVLRVSDLARLMSAGSGPSLAEYYAYYDPATRSLRTSQASFIEDSEESSVTFTKAGTMRRGFMYALPTLERPTEESGSSSWPTPDTTGGAPNKGSNKKSGPKSLLEAARLGHHEWRERETGDPTPTLPDQVGGSLNPTWVEALMGFPCGWTDISEGD